VASSAPGGMRSRRPPSLADHRGCQGAAAGLGGQQGIPGLSSRRRAEGRCGPAVPDPEYGTSPSKTMCASVAVTMPAGTFGCPGIPPPRHGAGTRAARHVSEDADRTDFVVRLATLAEQGAWIVYARALLSNHAHLLVRTGTRPLAAVGGAALIPPCGKPSTAGTSGAATSSRTGTSRSWWRRSPTSWSSSLPPPEPAPHDSRARSPDPRPVTPGPATARCSGGCPAPGRRRPRFSPILVPRRARPTPRGARHRDHARLLPPRTRPDALTGGGRRIALQRARAGIAYLWVEVLGHPDRPSRTPSVSVPKRSTHAVAAAGRRARSGSGPEAGPQIIPSIRVLRPWQVTQTILASSAPTARCAPPAPF